MALQLLLQHLQVSGQDRWSQLQPSLLNTQVYQNILSLYLLNDHEDLPPLHLFTKGSKQESQCLLFSRNLFLQLNLHLETTENLQNKISRWKLQQLGLGDWKSGESQRKRW